MEKFRLLVLLMCLILPSYTLVAATGTIHGTVVDQATGDVLIGANVFLEGTQLGSSTDLNGQYRIVNIPPGPYVMIVSMVSYGRKRVNGIEVADGGVLKMEISLESDLIEAEEVVVEASLLLESEAALLKSRQRSASVSDAISSEVITKTTSSNVADAMTRVTGVTVVDDKYIYVRGLGDRYNTTMMDGVVLPSANPDRNSVSLDLLPAKFIESIVTEKTFTADRPGDYTGGGVNIQTKSFPERFTLTLSAKTSFNSQSTGKDGFLTYPGGGTDWLGVDDGTRSIPNALQQPDVLPEFSSTFTNRKNALELDRLSNEFNTAMYPLTKSAPPNTGYALSIGDQIQALGMPVGYFASLSYARDFTSYTGGVAAQYSLTGNVNEVDELSNLYLYSDSRSVDHVLWGGLANLSIKPSPLHHVTASLNYSRTGEAETRYLAGSQPRDFNDDVVVETRVLGYRERELQTLRFSGNHVLPFLMNTDLEWTVATTQSMQDEPDLRYFTNDYTVVERSGEVDTLYSIRPSNYAVPSRYFRALEDGNDAYGMTATTPFENIMGFHGKVKLGASLDKKDRVFSERRFEYHATSRARYAGDPAAYFSPEVIGLVDSSNGFYTFGQYLVDASALQNSYNGQQDVSAFFGMLDLNIGGGFRFIGGLRGEFTELAVASVDTSQQTALLETDDLLPSASLVYSPTERMNIRLAYGKTLARPTFRELAPFASFDFVGDFIFIGNPLLRRTLVDNYDVRWEWFPRPSELIAVSVFYKKFRDPIERAIVSNNNQGQFQNVPSALVVGAEFEVRQRLDVVGDLLSNFFLQGNLSLIHSEVDIPEREMIVLRSVDPGAPAIRSLQGQSPYVLNLGLNYDNGSTGTNVTLSYNQFGRRLSRVSLGGTPNVFEFSRSVMDLVVLQQLFASLELKATVKNLLDSETKFAHTYKGQEYVVGLYKSGRVFSLGLTYAL